MTIDAPPPITTGRTSPDDLRPPSAPAWPALRRPSRRGPGGLAPFGLKAFTALNRAAFGFTLAELLIALAILGVIATFTIPKVLTAQQDSKYNSIGKEAMGMIAGAYDAYRL